jgi:hypothetical protein
MKIIIVFLSFKCVLGSCIAVALVSLLSKFGEFKKFWKVSKLDGVWIA